MAYRQFIVKHTDSESNTTTLRNTMVVNCTRSVNAGSNAIDITLSNYNNECYTDGEIKYKQNDILKVYATEGFVNVSNSNHLIGIYTVQDYSENAEANTIKLIGTDLTYNILNKIYIGTPTDKTVDQVVSTVVQFVNMGNGDSSVPVTTNIDSVDSNGDAFPTISYSSSNKTAYEVLLELSQTTMTGDNMNYSFWFDENLVFHWIYPNLTPVDTFIYGTLPTLTMKTQRQETTTVSTIIYNAGTNKNGTGIQRIYHDPTSTSYASKYLPMTRIADDARLQLGTVAYDAMTNDEFTNYVLLSAIPKAEAYIGQVGRGVWEASITAQGNRYQINGLYGVQFGRSAISTRTMRLITILHKFGADGWQSTLTFEEDIIYGN
jgi:hypothetical protein